MASILSNEVVKLQNQKDMHEKMLDNVKKKFK